MIISFLLITITSIKLKENKLLEYYWYYCFEKKGIALIIKLLLAGKNCKRDNKNTGVLHEVFNNTIKEYKEEYKKIFPITDEMYHTAIANKNYEALKTLFDYDGSEENTILKRIYQFDLLEKAVIINNYQMVKNILSYDDFNNKSYKYEEIITQAVKNKNKDITKLLVEAFIHNSSFPREKLVNSNNTSDIKNYDSGSINMVLNIFIKLGDFDLVKDLLENEKYAKSIDLNRYVLQHPMMVAFKYERIEIFKYLLNKGANVNINNNSNIPLFLLTVKNNKTNFTENMLNQINDFIKDTYIIDAFTIAVRKNYIELIELLLNYAKSHGISIPINKKNDDEDYLLIQAIYNNNFNLVVSLIQYGVEHKIDMNINDDENYTPLIDSYKKGYLEIFKFLIKHLNINEEDSSGNNLLHFAIDKGDTEMVNFLIHSGIHANTNNKKEFIKFNENHIEKNISIIKLLSDNDFLNLNEIDHEGNTPLFKIVKSPILYEEEKCDLIENFIKNGANINILDAHGDSLLKYGYDNINKKIVKLLLKNGLRNNKNYKYPTIY